MYRNQTSIHTLMSRYCGKLLLALTICAPTFAQSQEPLTRRALREEAVGCWTLLDGKGQPVGVSMSWVKVVGNTRHITLVHGLFANGQPSRHSIWTRDSALG